MMIFGGDPGRVVVLGGGGVPGSFSASGSKSFRLEGWDYNGGDGFNTFRSIITRVGASQRCNYQFLHSLDKFIYLYVFGDRIGRILISGLAFDAACGDPGFTGPSAVLDFYAANKLSSRAKPLRVTMGTSRTFLAFLSGMSLDLADPSMRLTQFNFELELVPEATGSSSGLAGTAQSASNANPGQTASGAAAPSSPPAGGGFIGSASSPSTTTESTAAPSAPLSAMSASGAYASY